MGLSSGIEKAIWDLLYQEAMYTELDLEDEENIKVIAETLNKIAKDLAGGDSDASCNSDP